MKNTKQAYWKITTKAVHTPAKPQLIKAAPGAFLGCFVPDLMRSTPTDCRRRHEQAPAKPRTRSQQLLEAQYLHPVSDSDWNTELSFAQRAGRPRLPTPSVSKQRIKTENRKPLKKKIRVQHYMHRSFYPSNQGVRIIAATLYNSFQASQHASFLNQTTQQH